MQANFMIILILVEGYSNPELALLCGTMIRECIRYEDLTKSIIDSEQFWLFFDIFVHLPNFDVASDAFNTLRELLVKNKYIAAEFLESKYTQIFEKYEVCMRHPLYTFYDILMSRHNILVLNRIWLDTIEIDYSLLDFDNLLSFTILQYIYAMI